MARSDLILSLVRAGASGDKKMLLTTVEALMADERAKSHHTLADRLQNALHTGREQKPAFTSIHASNSTNIDTLLQITPRIQFEDLVLSNTALTEGKQLVEEHFNATLLRAHGYEPRNKILLAGPPGNGKTSYAEAIAEAVGLPFYIVRYDTLIGSYLGETNARLRKLFDSIKNQPCVVFFDEFDAISKERGDTHETGEIKRVVSFLLMQIDQLPSHIITIAATNHAELLDRAVWRRFQIRVSFPHPNKLEISSYLKKVFASWPNKPKTSATKISTSLGAISYAEVREFCHNVRRRQILELGKLDLDSIIKSELKLWTARVNPRIKNDSRSNKTTPVVKRRITATKTNGKTKIHTRR